MGDTRGVQGFSRPGKFGGGPAKTACGEPPRRRRAPHAAPGHARRALSFQSVNFCAQCREKAKAFIRKPEGGKPGGVSPAARLARAAAVTCLLCGAIIEPATAAGAQVGTPADYSVMQLAGPAVQVPVTGPAAPGDHEPPHTDGPELTRDGSAATSSVTAPTARAPGLPWHALLRQYPPGPVPLPPPPGPHAAPTHRLAPPAVPGPFRPASGPGLA
jgi:hypothetical protein